MSLLIGSARVAIVPDLQGFQTDLRAKLDAELRSLGQPTIPIGFSIDDASLAAVRAELSAMPPADIGVMADLDVSTVAAARAEMDTELGSADDTSAAAAYWKAAATNWFRVGEAEFAAAAASVENSAGGSGGSGIFDALMGYKLIGGGGFFGTQIAGINAWHIALDGAIEVLISVGTAAAAAAVGVAAMYSTWADVHDHLQAVYDVNSALGFQIPDLTSKFNALQSSMAPQTIEIFGGAMSLVSGQADVFGNVAEKVVTMFDDWTARIDLWAKGQGTFDSLLNTGAGYLHQFGDVAGEAGVAIGNLLRR